MPGQNMRREIRTQKQTQLLRYPNYITLNVL